MPDRRRILVAIGSLGGGGSERQVLQFLKHFDRGRFEVVLYLVHRTGEFLDQVPGDVRIVAFEDSQTPARLSLPGLSHRAMVRHLVDVLHRERIDLCYDRTYHMALVAGPACRTANVRRVAAIVTEPIADLRNNERRFLRTKLWLLNRSYRAADRVVCNAEALRESVARRYHIPPSQLAVIPNGVAEEWFDATRPPPPNASLPFVIVAAGRLHYQKGFDVLMESIKQLKAARPSDALQVRIFGQGPLHGELEQQIDDHGLQETVQLAGFTANLKAEFSRSHLFCLSSRYEGMPNVVLEAMAARVPVVATDCVSGPAEILQRGRFGKLVPVGDVAALASAIGDVMDHYSPACERAREAQQHVRQQYSVESSTRRLETLVNEVLAGATGPQSR